MAVSQAPKPNSNQSVRNPLEALRDVGSSVANGLGGAARDMTTGFFDQMLGTNGTPDRLPSSEHYKVPEQRRPAAQKEFKNIWSFQQEQEMRTIRELVEQIKQEIKLLKQADKAFLNEVKDIEKITMEELPYNPGIYHIRFMELVIQILRTLRMKINESRTWLVAFQSKKKKRGSAFGTMSKKKGTSFSQSQELATARSVQ